MELIAIKTTELSELINTVRELRDTVKELLCSSKPSQSAQEEFITREQAMEYLHITSPGKFMNARKRYDLNCRRVGKKKLFRRSDLDRILEQNGNRLDLSDLNEKEIEAALHRNL